VNREHDILKTNANQYTSGQRAKHQMIQFWGQEVKDQGHVTPKLDLETWLRHSRPLPSSSFSSFIPHFAPWSQENTTCEASNETGVVRNGKNA